MGRCGYIVGCGKDEKKTTFFKNNVLSGTWKLKEDWEGEDVGVGNHEASKGEKDGDEGKMLLRILKNLKLQKPKEGNYGVEGGNSPKGGFYGP